MCAVYVYSEEVIHLFSSNTWWRAYKLIAIGHFIDYLCITFMHLLDFKHFKGFLRHSVSMSFHVTAESMHWLSVVNRRLYPSTCVVVLHIHFWYFRCTSIFGETILLGKPEETPPSLSIPVDRQQTGMLWEMTNSKSRKWMTVNLQFGLCFSVLLT